MKPKQKKKQWMQQQSGDAFVRQARKKGYRSRAYFKLEEIDSKDRLTANKKIIVDLGCAPGGWCQYLTQLRVKPEQIVGIDRLPMNALDSVDFLQYDFDDDRGIEAIADSLNGNMADLVISDIAPNITGIRSVDEAEFESILDRIQAFYWRFLAPRGDLLVKLFQGQAADQFRHQVKKDFAKILVRKPAASRTKSREFYLLCKQFVGTR